MDAILGKSLYEAKCATCHGPIEKSTKIGVTMADINRALEKQAMMAPLRGTLNAEQIRTLALALNGNIPITTCDVAPDVGRVSLHRLNSTEYNNTLRDLLGITYSASQDGAFPADDFGGNFNNNAKVLGVTSTHIQKYLAAAEKAVDAAMANATTKARIIPCDLNQNTCVTQVVSGFLLRAFRRPATSAELTSYTALVRSAQTAGDSLETGVKVMMAGALMSPHFLYRSPQHPQPNDPNTTVSLNDYELASRMSYFIWSSTPDPVLLEAARTGQLKTPDQLTAQAKRMLKDPKAAALLDNFATQWIRLNDLDQVQPAAALFPEFTAQIRTDMKTETKMLLKDIFDRDGSFFELIKADYTFINDRLATLYGIPGVTGSAFQKVSLLGQQRVGVLTHGSMMAVNANPDRTSIVKRGKWVLDNLLCTPPDPPPPEVISKLPPSPGNLSVRERMELHRQDPTCFSCHSQMDPIGFALENFDPLGRYRTSDASGPIDNRGEFPDGRQFSGARELSSTVSEDRRYRLCVAEKLFIYSLGRHPEDVDRCTINRIGLAAVDKDKPISAVVIEMILSDPFRKHRGEGK